MEVSQGTSQLLEFQFYLRGTVTYPVVLRIRKKTPDGTYDALPFIDLRKYGNVDYQQWMRIEHEVEIPVNPEDTQYQVPRQKSRHVHVLQEQRRRGSVSVHLQHAVHQVAVQHVSVPLAVGRVHGGCVLPRLYHVMCHAPHLVSVAADRAGLGAGTHCVIAALSKPQHVQQCPEVDESVYVTLQHPGGVAAVGAEPVQRRQGLHRQIPSRL
ncbi:hypothetical protein E2C01_037474 [Portunus trituberculatus]|uniref:Uncharacterized protein n=1 Tax=Portunus trituberculatus TaxID=210409 RepID=A0A5B7F880_PORTR|nr:hypothetical protein [Portunus trituberculatus]